MENGNNNIGFTYGLIGGALLILLFIGLYYSSPELLFRRMGIFAFLVLLLLMIWTGRVVRRKSSDAVFVFRELVRPIFTVFVVSMGVIVIFFYVFYNFWDTGMANAMRDWHIADITHQMELAGKSQEFMEKELETLKKGDYSYGFFKAMQVYVLSLVFGFLMAAAITVGILYARLWKEEF